MSTVRVSVSIGRLSPAVLPQPLDTGSPTLLDRKPSPTALAPLRCYKHVMDVGLTLHLHNLTIHLGSRYRDKYNNSNILTVIIT